MSELKNCPFCGGNAVTEFEYERCTYMTQCESCGCGTIASSSKEETEHDWNERASDKQYQALVTVHNVFCTAIRKAIGMECEMPVKDIVDTVVAMARNHRSLYEENSVLCKTLDRLLAASPETERRAREGNSVPSDHYRVMRSLNYLCEKCRSAHDAEMERLAHGKGHPITALCSCYSAGLEPSEDCPIHGYKPL